MKCLHCDGEKFEEQCYRVTPDVKGEKIEVIAPAMVCAHCNTPLMNDEQMSHLRKIAANAYRKAHGLITAEEIVDFRSKHSMSQAALADHLNIDEENIKRWETYFVQDVSQDKELKTLIQCKNG